MAFDRFALTFRPRCGRASREWQPLAYADALVQRGKCVTSLCSTASAQMSQIQQAGLLPAITILKQHHA
jgi:hypothetical protein